MNYNGKISYGCASMGACHPKMALNTMIEQKPSSTRSRLILFWSGASGKNIVLINLDRKTMIGLAGFASAAGAVLAKLTS